MSIAKRGLLFLIGCMLVITGALTPGSLTNNGIVTAEVNDLEFYVSPAGSDLNPGSLSEPFQSVHKAKEVVRGEIENGMDSNVIVYLRGGKYDVDSPLIFTPIDSGRDGFSVEYRAYPGEEPIIDGGSSLTNWSAVDGNVYKTSVADGWEFDTLYENGESSDKARHPDKGEIREDYLNTVEPYISANSKTQFHFADGDIPLGLDPNDGLEIYIWAGGPSGTWNWNSSIREIENIDYTQRIITLATPTGYEIGAGSRYYIRGNQVLLNAPGEFYLDKTADELYYWPRSLPIESQEIIAPKSIQVIGFIGDSETSLVENIVLEGLTIRNSDYHDKSQGQHAIVNLQYAKSITIKDNHIYNSGRHGIHASTYFQDSIISGNWIHNIGYSGVDLGGPSDADTMINNQIINNHIHDVGTQFGHGSGIYLLDAGSNSITHNRIHDASRYAISMKNLRSKNNLIQYNDVSNVNTDSQDTGIIESWNPGRGNVIDHNRIYNSNIHFSYGFGIYLDDNSHGTTVSNNVIHDLQQTGNGTLRNPILVKGVESHIANNFTINNQASVGPLGMSSSNQDLVVERNIFYNSGDSVYTFQDWSVDRFAAADDQLLYHENGIYGIAGLPEIYDFEEWRAFQDYRFDQRSLIALPQFMDKTVKDYRLRYDSPAKKLGIEEIDLANIGLLAAFKFGNGSDPLESLYPISSSGATLSSVVLESSQTMQLEVMGRTETGYFADLSTAAFDYESSSPQVATIDASGMITAVAPGIAEVKVTVQRGSEELKSFIHVLVDDALDIVHVDVARNQLPINGQTVLHIVGESEQGAFSKFSAGDAGVVITNLDPMVIDIDDQGNITALTNGEAGIEVAVTIDGVTTTGQGTIKVYDPISAYATIYPSDVSDYDGLTVGEEFIQNTGPGSWILFKNVDFGDIVPNRLEMEVAVPNTHSSGVIDVRLDSLSGTLLGSVSVMSTQGWTDFQLQTAALDELLDATGVHDIYFVFNENNSSEAGDFKSFRFDREPVPPTEPWQVTTYGEVNQSVDMMGDSFTIVSDGENIWGEEDEFTFVYQDIDAEIADNLSITATIDSLIYTHMDSATGVMIRAEDEAGAFNVNARIISNGGLRFTYRNEENLATWYQSGPNILFPATIKLTREEDLFTGYYLDDEEWVQFGQISTQMSGDVMAGIPVFSHHVDPAIATVSDIIFETEEPPIIDLAVTTGQTLLDTIGQTTTLEVSGLLYDETVIDLPIGTVVNFESTDITTVSVDVYGTVTAQGIGTAEINVSTTIDGLYLSSSIEIEVIPTLDNTSGLLDALYSEDQVETPLYNQLSNRLRQSEHHLENGRISQAIKHLNDFLKHINNPAMQSNIIPDAKAQLVYAVDYLIASLSDQL